MADAKKLKAYAAPTAENNLGTALRYWYETAARPGFETFGKNVANTGQDILNNGLHAGKNVIDFITANPLETGLYGITGAMNIGGLFDNNKIGGQLGGAALGTGIGFLPQLLQAAPLDPKYKVLLGMGGGAIGSLFDKLRAEKEQQEALHQQL